jgi:hypothetical protein
LVRKKLPTPGKPWQWDWRAPMCSKSVTRVWCVEHIKYLYRILWCNWVVVDTSYIIGGNQWRLLTDKLINRN